MLYNPKSVVFHENATLKHFIKKRFLYGYHMWPILKNMNNLYFFLPFLFVIFLMTFPITFYNVFYNGFYFMNLKIYLLIVLFETLRVFKTFFTYL